MRICILGLGVIGTTYGYLFSKAGFCVEHLVRKEVPKKLEISLLDGRFSKTGNEIKDTYNVNLAKANESYDFIFLSVASGKIKEAINYLKQNNIKGTLVFMCNFWDTRKNLEQIMDDYKCVVAFPVAGGNMSENKLECVVFNHILLENKAKANISNYDDLAKLFKLTNLKIESPYDMIEWIWLHMAINAGVTSAAIKNGLKSEPKELALNLMSSYKALKIAIKTIKETIKVVKARGVDLKNYKNELMFYKIPSFIGAIFMKRMFAKNKLVSKIMTLHNDKNDILYVLKSVYMETKKHNLNLPLFYKNTQNIINGLDIK